MNETNSADKEAPKQELREQAKPTVPTTIPELVGMMTMVQLRTMFRTSVDRLNQNGVSSVIALTVPARLLTEEQQKSLVPEAGDPGALSSEEAIQDVTYFYCAIHSEEQREQFLKVIASAPLQEPEVASAADGAVG